VHKGVRTADLTSYEQRIVAFATRSAMPSDRDHQKLCAGSRVIHSVPSAHFFLKIAPRLHPAQRLATGSSNKKTLRLDGFLE
jgi:hypothetical protein